MLVVVRLLLNVVDWLHIHFAYVQVGILALISGFLARYGLVRRLLRWTAEIETIVDLRTIVEVLVEEVGKINFEEVEHLLDRLVAERKSCGESFRRRLVLVKVANEEFEGVVGVVLGEVEGEVVKVVGADHH